MTKPVKEWGAVRFLSHKAPEILSEVAGGILDVATGRNPINVVRDRIKKKVDQSSLTGDDREYAMMLVDSELEREHIASKDRMSARLMHETALKHGGHLARNFVYYIGAGTILMAFASLITLMFVEVPESNKSIVDMSIGFIFGTGLATVLNFFFGSSSDSKDSKTQLGDLISRVTK